MTNTAVVCAEEPSSALARPSTALSLAPPPLPAPAPVAGQLDVPSARLILPPDAPEDEWNAARRQGIGGSDAAGIIQLSPWSTPVSVYLDKLGRLPWQDNDAMRWGRALEDAIAQEWSRETGWPVWKTGTYAHHQRTWQRANPDRLCLADDQLVGVEIKTADRRQRHYWDEGRSPIYYLTQIQHYAAVTGIAEWWLICLIAGNELVVRHVLADIADMTALTRAEHRFWHRNVVPRRPPLVSVRDAAHMRLLYPSPTPPGQEVQLPPSAAAVLREHAATKKEISRLKKHAEALEVRIKDWIREGAYGTLGARRVVSWLPGDRPKMVADPGGARTPVRTLRHM